MSTEIKDGKIPICVWPDGFWCYHENIEQFSWKSDDYIIVHTPAELDYESVSAAVARLVRAQS